MKSTTYKTKQNT